MTLAQPLARPDHDLAAHGIKADHVKRLGRRDADAATLADRVVDDAAMAAEHTAIDVDDVACLCGAGPEALDDVGIAASRHEADVLAVGLLRRHQPELTGE